MKKCAGIFVSIDGPNGVGKTTLIQAVAKKLTAVGFRVLVTKELTDSPLGKFIRDQHREYRGKTLALLLAADRNNHVELTIKPALEVYDIVITDRYIESSLVFQRLDGVELTYLWQLNKHFLQPHLSVSVSASPETIKSRMSDRKAFDRFETTHTREDEVRLFIEASKFIEKRGYKVLRFVNEKMTLNQAATSLSSSLLACAKKNSKTRSE